MWQGEEQSLGVQGKLRTKEGMWTLECPVAL